EATARKRRPCQTCSNGNGRGEWRKPFIRARERLHLARRPRRTSPRKILSTARAVAWSVRYVVDAAEDPSDGIAMVARRSDREPACAYPSYAAAFLRFASSR